MAGLTQQGAPCVIVIDARGCATVEITDAEGEVHSYGIEPAPEGLDRWACHLTRLDGKGDSPYRVALSLSGVWRCACADMVYSRRTHRSRKRGAPCKHIENVRPWFLAANRLQIPNEKEKS